MFFFFFFYLVKFGLFGLFWGPVEEEEEEEDLRADLGIHKGRLCLVYP